MLAQELYSPFDAPSSFTISGLGSKNPSEHQEKMPLGISFAQVEAWPTGPRFWFPRCGSSQKEGKRQTQCHPLHAGSPLLTLEEMLTDRSRGGWLLPFPAA